MRFSHRIKGMYYRMDYKASKKIFGNTAGARNNLSGKFKRNTVKVEELEDSRIKVFLKNQFVGLELPYDPNLIEVIRKKYEALIENEKTSYVTSEYEGKVYCRHITDPQLKIEELGKLITPEIKKIIEEYYGKNFEVRRIDLWRNYYVPEEVMKKKETFSNYWHCDARSTEFLKLFVYPNDVTDKDGPFHIITQDRTRELMKKGFGTREDYNLSLDEIEDSNHIAKMTGNSGTAFMANTEFCLHRAGKLSQGHKRDVIQFVFVPTEKPLPTNWFEKFSQDEKYRLGTHYKKGE